MSVEVAYAGSPLAGVSCAEGCGSPDTSAASYVEQNSCEHVATFGASELVERDAVFTAGILDDASKVLRSFNTWTFKREQPSNSQLMLRIVASAIASSKPIPFVLYWGKGPRQQVAPPDIQCLDFLAALAERVKRSYAPGARIRLIFTDTHAELNGHTAECIKHYFDNVTSEAQRRGFDTCSLSKLVKMAGSGATATPLDEVVSEGLLAILITSAIKWYQGSASPKEGALAYLRMNLIEQRVVERAYPDSIFITFNGSRLRPLFPRQLPIFYMYSLRRGFSVKPWFLPDDHKSSRD
jgi:hypothetical protein